MKENDNLTVEIDSLKQRVAELERVHANIVRPPLDFRFLKDWITREELERMCTLHAIGRHQADNIIKGSSKNWPFLDALILKAQERMRAIEKTLQMEKHLIDFKNQNLK